MGTRRDFLGALCGAAACGGAAAAPKRPNVLFLLTDDQRFNTVHALGNPEVRTPNMDRLAARGTAFTRAHIMGGTIAAVCAPSRGMLMTGQHLFHVHDSIIEPKAHPERPRKPFALMPEVFRKQGYTTFATGKWHNGEKLFARCFSAGESIFFGGMSNHRQVPVADFDPSGEYPAAKRHTGGKFSSELFSDSAIRFLESRRGGDPFFAYVAYTAPHDPRMAPKEYLDLYPPDRIALPGNFLPQHPFDNGELRVRDELLAPFPRTPQVVREHIAAYYAMITHLDAQIGRVLDALERAGHANDTLIVFAADNGLAVGQHGLMGKQNLYDHSVRVPLVISGPGLTSGRRTDALCYLHDVFPTLCDLAGIPIPGTVESSSVAPVLNGRKEKVRDSVFFAYRDVQRGVSTGEWKLIVYSVNGVLTKQLFHLKADPLETKDLAGEAAQKPRLAELESLLRDWMRKTDDPLTLAF